MITGYVRGLLLEQERPYKVFRYHWLWFIKKLWLSILILFLCLVLAVKGYPLIAGLLAVVPAIHAAICCLHWWNHVCVITNLRVFQTGAWLPFLSNMDVVPLGAIQNIDVDRTPWWRSLLGEANYNIQTGQGNIPLNGYPNGIDKAIWEARNADSLPPQSQTLAQGKIIVK